MLFSLLFHSRWARTIDRLGHYQPVNDSCSYAVNSVWFCRCSEGFDESFGWFFPRNARLEVLGCRMPRLSIQDLLTCGKNDVHDEKSLKSSSLTVHFLSDTLVSKSTLFYFPWHKIRPQVCLFVSQVSYPVLWSIILSCIHIYIYKYTHNIYTLPETNMAPENVWLEYDCFLLGPGRFSGANLLSVAGSVNKCVSFIFLAI